MIIGIETQENLTDKVYLEFRTIKIRAKIISGRGFILNYEFKE